VDPIQGTVITVEESFDIPGTGYPAGGTLFITCDNGYEAFMNASPVGSAQVTGAWQTSDLKQASLDTTNWQSVEQYDVSAALQHGTNVLAVDAGNEYFDTDDVGNPWPGTVSNNPGALIYAMEVDYYDVEETAWGCGEPFSEGRKNGGPNRNWATYITYDTQCWIELSADAFATSEWVDGIVHLWINSTPPATQGDEARIHIPMPAGTTLGDIDAIEWMAYVVAGYAPHVDVLLDVNGGDALVFEYAYNTVAGHVPEGWPDYGVTQDTWFPTFGDDDPLGLTAVDDAALAWLASGPPGPPPPGDPGNFGTLADWKAGITYGPVTVDSDTPVTGINIEIDNWIPQPAQTEAYVDDVVVTFAP